MRRSTLQSAINCFKGCACGVMVWVVMFVLRRYVISHPLLSFLRLPFFVLGPLVLYPAILWFVLRFQLPPLSPEYIRRKWPLWIPGLLIAIVPSVDVLFLGKRLMGLLMG